MTFVMGLFAGGYLYLVGFSTLIKFDAVPEVQEMSVVEMEIVSEVYGGCRNNCPLFRLDNKGSYRYLYTPEAGAAQIVREGSLPLSLQRELRSALSISQLTNQSKLITPIACNSYVDGIDVKYEITIDGKEFVLNSCGTAVEGGGALWSALAKIWNYFETN